MDDKEFKKKIGARLKELRLELDLTQEELADKLDSVKGKSSIANYENGSNLPSDEVKLQMCKIFNCSLDYLMCKSDVRNPEKVEVDNDKLKIGLSVKDYSNITDEQKKQIEDFAKFVLKDNLKKNEEK